MRSRAGVLIASAASAAALAVSVGSALAQTAHPQKTGGTCHYTFGPSGPRGLSGTVSCSRPAGKGTAKSRYQIASAGAKEHVTGTFKDTFSKGAISGTYRVSGPVQGPYHGTFKVTKATGKLSSAHGGGSMDCSSNGVNALHCTQTFTKGGL